MVTLENMHFESGLLSAIGSGEFSLEGSKQVFLEMLAAVAQYKAEKVIFDGRKLEVSPMSWSVSYTPNSRPEKPIN